MADHPKEAQRELRQIFLCDDICLDVFRWLSPAKVGLALALVCDRFDALVDNHFRSRRWALGKFRIVKSPDGDAAIVKLGTNGPTKTLSIAQMPPLPNGVIGFERISCWSNGDEVVAFLRRIGRLLQSDITLVLSRYLFGNVFVSIWPLLYVSGIIKMEFINESALASLRRLISPSVLRDCANLRFVYAAFLKPSLRLPPDDSAGTSEAQALYKWLHTPLGNGQPKVLKIISGGISMDELKTEFLNASTGVNFIILFVGRLVPFELENSLTQERLAVRTVENNNRWIIVRSQIDKNEKCAEWEREALEECFNWNVLELLVDG